MLPTCESANEMEESRPVDDFNKNFIHVELLLNEADSRLDSSSKSAFVNSLKGPIRKFRNSVKDIVYKRARNYVIPKIKEWNHNHQKLKLNLRSKDNQPIFAQSVSLSELESLCDTVAKPVWELYKQLHQHIADSEGDGKPTLPDLENDDSKYFRDLRDKVKTLLESFLSQSLIVEEQPQVIRTDKLIEKLLKVTLLVKCVFQGNEEYRADVKVYFTDENNARDHLQKTQDSDIKAKWTFAKSLKLSKGKKKDDEVIEVLSQSRTFKNFQQFSVTFNENKQYKIKPGTVDLQERKQSGDQAPETKDCFLIACHIEVGNIKLKFSTISHPVSVISNGSQSYLGKGTIAWDSLFAEIDRVTFHVRKTAPWNDVELLLNSECINKTGRGLSEANMKWLKTKAGNMDSESNSTDTISFNALCKAKKDNLGFYQWYLAALGLLTDRDVNINELWKKGYIFGFVSRDKAENILRDQEVGTFLIRFSDSQKEAISVSVVVGARKVAHTEPYDLIELKAKHLAVYLMEMKDAKKLYQENGSNPPKEEVLKDFFPTTNTQNVVTRIPPYRPLRTETTIELGQSSGNRSVPTSSSESESMEGEMSMPKRKVPRKSTSQIPSTSAGLEKAKITRSGLVSTLLENSSMYVSQTPASVTTNPFGQTLFNTNSTVGYTPSNRNSQTELSNLDSGNNNPNVSNCTPCSRNVATGGSTSVFNLALLQQMKPTQEAEVAQDSSFLQNSPPCSYGANPSSVGAIILNPETFAQNIPTLRSTYGEIGSGFSGSSGTSSSGCSSLSSSSGSDVNYFHGFMNSSRGISTWSKNAGSKGAAVGHGQGQSPASCRLQSSTYPHLNPNQSNEAFSAPNNSSTNNCSPPLDDLNSSVQLSNNDCGTLDANSDSTLEDAIMAILGRLDDNFGNISTHQYSNNAEVLNQVCHSFYIDNNVLSNSNPDQSSNNLAEAVNGQVCFQSVHTEPNRVNPTPEVVAWPNVNQEFSNLQQQSMNEFTFAVYRPFATESPSFGVEGGIQNGFYPRQIHRRDDGSLNSPDFMELCQRQRF